VIVHQVGSGPRQSGSDHIQLIHHKGIRRAGQTSLSDLIFIAFPEKKSIGFCCREGSGGPRAAQTPPNFQLSWNPELPLPLYTSITSYLADPEKPMKPQ
jgi:hypothetical protein